MKCLIVLLVIIAFCIIKELLYQKSIDKAMKPFIEDEQKKNTKK